MDITAIDFETANGSPASVCSVGLATMDGYGSIETPYSTLIRPADNVSSFWPMNISIHGIHPSDVAGAPSFREVYMDLKPYLSDHLVCAHNAGFDMDCLAAACENCGLRVPEVQWFDTVILSRRLWPQLSHHRLNDVCDYLGIELNHHRADSDAAGCLQIVANAMNQTGIFDVQQLLEEYQVPVYSLSSRTGRSRRLKQKDK